MSSQHTNIVKTIDSYLRAKQNEAQTQAQESNSDEEEKEEEGKSVSCALVIAGFHTGRSTVARFFKIATGSSSFPPTSTTHTHTHTQVDTPAASAREQTQISDSDKDSDSDEDEEEETSKMRGTLRAAELFEVDVDCNVRPWLPSRAGEDKHAAKRWCVVGVLVRR